jgi:hypothetical protein
VFAGGIGENAPPVPARICGGLGFLGIELEETRNATNEGVISAAASEVAVRVIHTDEELMIAKTVCGILGFGGKSENGIMKRGPLSGIALPEECLRATGRPQLEVEPGWKDRKSKRCKWTDHDANWYSRRSRWV